ncbi:hypothetical protein FQZ97_658390 [compost metagenome]
MAAVCAVVVRRWSIQMVRRNHICGHFTGMIALKRANQLVVLPSESIDLVGRHCYGGVVEIKSMWHTAVAERIGSNEYKDHRSLP